MYSVSSHINICKCFLLYWTSIFIIITALCRWMFKCHYCLSFSTQNCFWKLRHRPHHWRMQTQEGTRLKKRLFWVWQFLHNFVKLKNDFVNRVLYFHFLFIRPRNRRKKDLHFLKLFFEVLVVEGISCN